MLNAPTLKKDDEPEAAGAGPEPVVSRPCIVVLGAGRSGTSVVARLLGELGVTIEKSLDAAGEQNPSGFAEDAFVVGMNKKLVEATSAGPQIPPRLSDAERVAIRPIVKELAKYIGSHAAAAELWGFKDPRTAFYLPVYRRIFNKLRLVPKYILCVRNPADTVTSFLAHTDADPEIAQLAYFSKNLAVLRETGLNCFIIHYEKLLEDPVSQARKLADFVHDGREPPVLNEATILRTVRPSLNRSGAMPARITNPLVERLYAALRPCEGADFDRETLRGTVKELSELEQAFLPWAYLGGRKPAGPDRGTKPEDRRELEEAQATCKQLAKDNAALADQFADARLIAEAYQRRAVAAEDGLARLQKEMAAEQNSQRKAAKPAKAMDGEKLRKLERERVKGELPYRLGRLVLDVYSRPLGKGLRLPAALLALRAESRRKRAARKTRAAFHKSGKA